MWTELARGLILTVNTPSVIVFIFWAWGDVQGLGSRNSLLKSISAVRFGLPEENGEDPVQKF